MIVWFYNLRSFQFTFNTVRENRRIQPDQWVKIGMQESPQGQFIYSAVDRGEGDVRIVQPRNLREKEQQCDLIQVINE